MRKVKTKYTTRLAEPKDTEQIADLVYAGIKETYPNRNQTSRLTYSFTVARWLAEERVDMAVVSDGNEIIGCVKCSKTCHDTLLEPYYTVNFIYVKPNFRKGRATYVLYHWLEAHIQEVGLITECMSLNFLSRSHAEKLKAKPIGTLMEFSSL